MSFQQGLSGLNAAARNLDVIGNNVANANTVGAKMARAEFADIYASSLSGGGNNAIGIGVQVATIAQQFTQGDISTTNNPLDVAINGAGFFPLSDNGAPVYTRSGQFKVDADGYIVSTQGLKLQGFMADSNGQVGGVTTDLRLNVDGVAPQATSELALRLNVDARATVPTLAFDATDTSTYSGVTTTKVFSPQGVEHTLAMYFRKAADNQWEVHAALDGTMFASNPVSTLDFDAATGRLPSTFLPFTQTVDVPAAEGGPIDVEIDLTGLTQFGSPFAVTEMTQNGYAPGDLAGFSIAPDGMLMARYSNGRTLTQGQLTLVNFRNPQGLAPAGSNNWTATSVSGEALTPQAPGTGNLGVLQSGALEQSNVDLTGELVNMITAQRIYQANAQTIKAQDQLLQTITNLR
ncbi:MAG: flagellar hook protein FlgE [Burkholderiaceae bacterium]|nr:MAG: flagellar hook protein FlgE [Burkholderiaceae bacterium]